MHSLSQCQQLLKKVVAGLMNSSAAKCDAMGWYGTSLTQRMPDRLATSTSTSGRAGVKRF